MMLVWYEGSKGNCVAKFVKSEKEYDYFRIFWLGVPLFLFVLCGMTFIGIRYFVEYINLKIAVEVNGASARQPKLAG